MSTPGWGAWPSTVTWPRNGSCTPAIARSSVVLPAPLRPITATISPRPIVRSMSRKRGHVAVPHLDAPQLDERGAGRGDLDLRATSVSDQRGPHPARLPHRERHRVPAGEPSEARDRRAHRQPADHLRGRSHLDVSVREPQRQVDEARHPFQPVFGEQHGDALVVHQAAATPPRRARRLAGRAGTSARPAPGSEARPPAPPRSRPVDAHRRSACGRCVRATVRCRADRASPPHAGACARDRRPGSPCRTRVRPRRDRARTRRPDPAARTPPRRRACAAGTPACRDRPPSPDPGRFRR